jgi:formamidopyrimidine-DNA glycosylase
MLVGHRVRDARRVGKYLLLVMDDGSTLVVHLRMSGQLRLHRPDEPDAPHTHAWLDLDDGRQLRFVDPRTFGEMFVAADGELELLAPSLMAMGPDPLESPPSRAELHRLLSGHRLAMKGFLLRGDLVAGIGNIYSDEILHVARLRHDRRTDGLSAHELGRLQRAIPEVIGAAVEQRGSSLSDAQYVDLFGQPGQYQHSHQVYGRRGADCHRCGTPIERATFQQRSTFYCPRCQR